MTPAEGKLCWRDVIRVHPAAELWPVLDPTEHEELTRDISENGVNAVGSDFVAYSTSDGPLREKHR